MENKKEWLLDRAEYMLAEIENEIASLYEQNEKDRNRIEKIEDEFSASEEEFYIAAIDEGLDEDEASSQRDDLFAEHMHDEYLTKLKQQLHYNELRLTALRQDAEIYKFYIDQNLD